MDFFEWKDELPTIHSYNGFSYYGDREGWYRTFSHNINVGTLLDESNFNYAVKQLRSKFPELEDGVGIEVPSEDYLGRPITKIEYTGGWAIETYRGFGGQNVLLVYPESEDILYEIFKMWEELQNYPVLDDDDYSQLVYDNAYCTECDTEWNRCESHDEHLEYYSEPD